MNLLGFFFFRWIQQSGVHVCICNEITSAWCTQRKQTDFVLAYNNGSSPYSEKKKKLQRFPFSSNQVVQPHLDVVSICFFSTLEFAQSSVKVCPPGPFKAPCLNQCLSMGVFSLLFEIQTAQYVCDSKIIIFQSVAQSL